MIQWFEKVGVPVLYKLILVEIFATVLINLGLNYHWVSLIFKQLYRMAFKKAADASFEGDGGNKGGEDLEKSNEH